MICDDATRQLSLMLYGELSFDEEEAIHQHLEACEPCRSALDQVRAVHARLDSGEPDLPPQLLQDNRRALRLSVAALREAEIPRSRFAWFRRLMPSTGMLWRPAAGLALLVVGFAAGRYAMPESGFARLARACSSVSRLPLDCLLACAVAIFSYSARMSAA